jgi:hypothetical protein
MKTANSVPGLSKSGQFYPCTHAVCRSVNAQAHRSQSTRTCHHNMWVPHVHTSLVVLATLLAILRRRSPLHSCRLPRPHLPKLLPQAACSGTSPTKRRGAGRRWLGVLLGGARLTVELVTARAKKAQVSLAKLLTWLLAPSNGVGGHHPVEHV